MFCALNRLNELPEKRFDWQIDNCIFNRPIMAGTQILALRVGRRGGDFGAVLQTDLTRV